MKGVQIGEGGKEGGGKNKATQDEGRERHED